MSGACLVTDAMRKMIGVESEPICYEVEKGAIRKIVRALEDTNPLWKEPGLAGKSQHQDLVAPPAYFMSVYPRTPKVRIETPLARRVGGGDEWQFFSSVRPGDVMVVKRKVADIYEKQGRQGKMLFIVYEDTFKLQSGEIVALHRTTQIRY